MRYEVRFCNGSWGAFDTHTYATACLFGRLVDAQEAVAWENPALPKR